MQLSSANAIRVSRFKQFRSNFRLLYPTNYPPDVHVNFLLCSTHFITESLKQLIFDIKMTRLCRAETQLQLSSANAIRVSRFKRFRSNFRLLYPTNYPPDVHVNFLLCNTHDMAES